MIEAEANLLVTGYIRGASEAAKKTKRGKFRRRR